MKTFLLLIMVLITTTAFAQDPARTPKEPATYDKVTTVDGSTGKYRNKHKHPNGHNWARRKKHADTVKPSKRKEKSKSKTREETVKG